MIDRERTASMAKLPDAVAIYRKQQEFARARVEAEYKNPKDRILATINAYNRKARTKRTPVLPALTPGKLQRQKELVSVPHQAKPMNLRKKLE